MEIPEPPKEREKLATLAGDIIHDTQKLVEQHVQLAKAQFFQDWGNAKPFALWMSIGLITLVSVGVLSALCLVHLLNAVTELPLWACFGIVDSFFIAVGATSFLIARQKIKGLSFANE